MLSKFTLDFCQIIFYNDFTSSTKYIIEGEKKEKNHEN